MSNVNLLFGAVLPAISIVSHVFAAPPTRQEVIDACAMRQRSAESFHIEWDGTRRILQLDDISFPSGKKVVDTSINFTCSLSVDSAGQVRYTTSDQVWSHSKQRFVDFSEDTAFNTRGRTTVQDSDLRAAVIGNPDDSHALQYVRYLPIRLAYRLFDRSVGVLDLHSFSLVQTADKSGDLYVVATHEPSEGRIVKVWLDSTRGFIPFRYLQIDEGTVTQEINMKYTAHATGGWRLAAWDVETKNVKGEILDFLTALVTSSELGTAFDTDHFSVKVPNSSLVEDFERKQRYVLQNDGTKIIVDRGVTEADVHSLIETGRYADSEGYGWGWLLVISLVVILPVVAFLVVRGMRVAG